MNDREMSRQTTNDKQTPKHKLATEQTAESAGRRLLSKLQKAD